MYTIIKNIIESKDYELEELKERIDYMYLNHRITKEEAEELKALAETNFDTTKNPRLDSKVEEMDAEIRAIKQQLERLNEKVFNEKPMVDEYPPFNPNNNGYVHGDKITFEGRRYKCILPKGGYSVIYSPSDYPQGWEEVI